MNSEIENKIDGLVEELKNSLEFLDDKALTSAKIQVLFYLKGYLESSEIDPETVLEDIITGNRKKMLGEYCESCDPAE